MSYEVETMLTRAAITYVLESFVRTSPEWLCQLQEITPQLYYVHAPDSRAQALQLNMFLFFYIILYVDIKNNINKSISISIFLSRDKEWIDLESIQFDSRQTKFNLNQFLQAG